MNYISTNYNTVDETPMPYDEAFIRQPFATISANAFMRWKEWRAADE